MTEADSLDLYLSLRDSFAALVVHDPDGRVLLLAVGAFIGAFVAGVAGFGFSAAAGAAVLHVMEPVRAIPFLMLCSIVVQVIGLVRLRASVECRACGSFVMGGLIGAPMAVWLLTHLDAANLRAAFGVFLLIYTGHTYFGLMRARRGLAAAGVPVAAKPVADTPPGALASGGIGLLSGFVGGLTAMPGAVLSAWCDIAGYDKARQRGMVQPFILAMQITALVWVVGAGSVLDRGLVEDLLRSLPALLAGVALGLAVYARMNAAMFRQTVLVIIAASGLSLAVL